jgi:hypothetical protein
MTIQEPPEGTSKIQDVGDSDITIACSEHFIWTANCPTCEDLCLYHTAQSVEEWTAADYTGHRCRKCSRSSKFVRWDESIGSVVCTDVVAIPAVETDSLLQ